MLAMGRSGFPKKEMDDALGRLRRTYERMDDSIKDSGGPWLLGRNITLADVSVMPALVRMADLGPRWRLGRSAARRQMVRLDTGSRGVQADILFGLAPDGTLPTLAEEGDAWLNDVSRLRRRLR